MKRFFTFGKISIILLVAGVIIILSPLVGQLYTQYQQNRMISEWYNSPDDESGQASLPEADPSEAYNQLQQAFALDSSNKSGNSSGQNPGTASTDPGSTVSNSNSGAAAAKTAKSSQTVLGIIKISKIKVNCPVVEGVSPKNLSSGIGHLPGTAGLGQPGNCALAGHRSYTFGHFFNRLDEVGIGDEIVLITKKGEYRYKVYDKLVITPDDLSILNYEKGDNILTLITCTPIYIATHRLVLHARLVSQPAMQP